VPKSRAWDVCSESGGLCGSAFSMVGLVRCAGEIELPLTDPSDGGNCGRISALSAPIEDGNAESTKIQYHHDILASRLLQSASSYP
jgi:hypothetical protein